MTKADRDKAELEKFCCVRSRFYRQTDWIYTEPIIERTVINGTEQAISRAFFKGTISSSGRSVPWLVHDFNYKISGGLEPGEEATWRLAPGSYSDWDIEVPKDAIMTIQTVRVNDAKGEDLYSIEDFGEQEAERLKVLLGLYPELRVE